MDQQRERLGRVRLDSGLALRRFQTMTVGIMTTLNLVFFSRNNCSPSLSRPRLLLVACLDGLESGSDLLMQPFKDLSLSRDSCEAAQRRFGGQSLVPVISLLD